MSTHLVGKSTELIDPRLTPLPREDLHGKFIREALQKIMKEAVCDACSSQSKVLKWQSPEDLRKKLDLSLPKTGVSHEELLKLIETVIQYSVKVGHPFFANQLFGGLDPYGLVGQMLASALNPSVYTYEVSPVFSIMEEEVLKEMRKIVGYTDEAGNVLGDGLFSPGGSMANGYAISCARYHFYPKVKVKGVHSIGRLVVFSSEDAHYSTGKLTSFMGMGSSNSVTIRTDERGRMIPEELEKAVISERNKGGIPFMVVATCGTTVLGSFDPVPKIAPICKKYKLWLHIDSAWGGGCLMSSKTRHLLQGVEKSDSIIWNPHKLLAAPQQCSVFLTKHAGLLSAAHSASASYLFQPDKFYDTSYDSGDKHIQCGRRADVLKFWLMWKAKGASGFEQHINKVFYLAQYFLKQIEELPDFKIAIPEPQCTDICFWYIPPSLINEQEKPDFNERLHKVAPVIKERMMREGCLMITYQPYHELPNFFRLVIINSGMETRDLDKMIKIFQRLGADL